MAVLLKRAHNSALGPRILSGLLLAPLPIAAIWFGSPWLPLLTAAAAAIMAWEWGWLTRRGATAQIVLVAVVLACVAAAALWAAPFAIVLAAAGAGLVFWTARGASGSAASGGEAKWAAAGALWVALPSIALLWLAHSGRATLLWILAVVWATDIGAYAVGRSIGGPRLAPRWSPQKTWSGLFGGMLSAAFAGWATACVLGIAPAFPLVATSATLAIVEQFGDLAESAAKRRFGAKDTSGLIPGHGGLLDRLDGLLAVIPAVALLTLIGGRSVLSWR
jgi:phosphatidate cytidylyltransferase